MLLIVTKLKVWEVAAAGVGLAFAAVFLLSNASGVGVALLAADLLWVLTRVEIVGDHDEPGSYTTARGQLGVMKLVLLLVIYGAAVYGFFVIRHDFGTKARASVVADFGLAGLCFMLLTELRRSGDDALDWIRGARSERIVGGRLNQFRNQGWLVIHGYKKDRGGDIDHILCGPNGGYIVETKSYGFRARDVGQAAGNAWWLREKLGVQWVTGVLCVNESRPPEKKGKIWVVSHEDIVEWLREHRDTPVDPDHARARLIG